MSNTRFQPTTDQYSRQGEKAIAIALAEGEMTSVEVGYLREFIGEIVASQHITPGGRYKLI